MELFEIITQIKSEKERKVIIQWHSQTDKELQIESECWNLTLTNDPEMYFEQMNMKFKNRAKHFSSFKVDSVEEGVQLCKGLFKFYELKEEEIPLPPNIDTKKELYLAIHIHYHLN